MRNKHKIFFAFLLLGLTLANFSSAALVSCGGYNRDGSLNECTIGNLIGTIRLIINFLLSWAWLFSILFIVIAGIRMILSRGDTEAISVAKQSLGNAVLGFVIILLSFVILNTVIGLLTGRGNINAGALQDSFRLVP